jgi:2-polyprenyl-3-methyl-5-hydroxy-6-metoxy-1,4-benzoquinol methylase
MSEALNKFRENSSIDSRGTSNHYIIESLLKALTNLPLKKEQKIIDVGIGAGELAKKIIEKNIALSVTGVDLLAFADYQKMGVSFYPADLNKDFPAQLGKYSVVVSSHVLLYLENGWHFCRELLKLTENEGYIIFACPNPISITGLLSLIFRGRTDLFNFRFPGHINAPTYYEVLHMFNTVAKSEGIGLRLVSTDWVGDGRIPLTSQRFIKYFPFIRNRFTSESFTLTFQRV